MKSSTYLISLVVLFSALSLGCRARDLGCYNAACVDDTFTNAEAALPSLSAQSTLDTVAETLDGHVLEVSLVDNDVDTDALQASVESLVESLFDHLESSDYPLVPYIQEQLEALAPSIIADQFGITGRIGSEITGVNAQLSVLVGREIPVSGCASMTINELSSVSISIENVSFQWDQATQELIAQFDIGRFSLNASSMTFSVPRGVFANLCDEVTMGETELSLPNFLRSYELRFALEDHYRQQVEPSITFEGHCGYTQTVNMYDYLYPNAPALGQSGYWFSSVSTEVAFVDSGADETEDFELNFQNPEDEEAANDIAVAMATAYGMQAVRYAGLGPVARAGLAVLLVGLDVTLPSLLGMFPTEVLGPIVSGQTDYYTPDGASYEAPPIAMHGDYYAVQGAVMDEAVYFSGGIDDHQEHFQILAVELDEDLDRILDSVDNCPDFYNPNQEDGDYDGIGDSCDDDPFSIPNLAQLEKFLANMETFVQTQSAIDCFEMGFWTREELMGWERSVEETMHYENMEQWFRVEDLTFDIRRLLEIVSRDRWEITRHIYPQRTFFGR